MPEEIPSLAAGGEYFAIDNARVQGLSYDPTLLAQHDFADWVLYLFRVLARRSSAERFAILVAASLIAIRGTYGEMPRVEQLDEFTNELASAYVYLEQDRDPHTARAVLVMAFLGADPR